MPILDALNLNVPFDQLFQTLLLPMLIIFAILWALLNSIRVFERKINLVLSLALTIMAAMTPQFNLFTTYVAQLGMQVALVAFFLLFAFGSIMWMFGKGRGIYYEQLDASKGINYWVKKKAEWLDKADQAGHEGKENEKRAWLKKAKEAEEEVELLSTRK
jgi:hypothetical protein